MPWVASGYRVEAEPAQVVTQILAVILVAALVVIFITVSIVAGLIEERDKWRERARLSTARSDRLEAQIADLESKGLVDVSRVMDVYEAHGKLAALRAWRRR